MQFSKFGQKFTQDAGILSLMDDLGTALTVNKKMFMLGGGNPGISPEMTAIFGERLAEISQEADAVHRLVGIYDPPRGNVAFNTALAKLLNREYGWAVTEENICLTQGSQSAFFMLFNMLAGEQADGSYKKIQLPLTPEYIGYSDVGIGEALFISSKPKIEMLVPPFFKYHVDFSTMQVAEDAAAICVSRPTNPTGNVLTDNEIMKLNSMAEAHGIPLIIDNAYGMPFPQIVYKNATPYWNENIILCMSLSKLGLPAARTGIVIARKEITEALGRINSIINLAPGSIGAQIVTPLIESGEILTLSKKIIQPFYRSKMEKAVEALKFSLRDIPFYIHIPEGAMFLWLWFPELPVSSLRLYELLKERGALIVSGHYFFPGLEDEWPHRNQCIRMTYSQDDIMVKQGIELLATVLNEL